MLARGAQVRHIQPLHFPNHPGIQETIHGSYQLSKMHSRCLPATLIVAQQKRCAMQSGNLAANFEGMSNNQPRQRTIYRIDNAALKAARAAERPQTPDTLKVDESTPPADK